MKKVILTYVIAIVVILPAFAVFNESDNLIVNLGGLAYLLILLYVGTTKVGKKGLKCLYDANNELAKRLGI